MRVLLDTNVVLDVLLAREPFVGSAVEIFTLIEHSLIEGFLCATTITTVDYLLQQALPRQDARDALRRLLSLFEIAPVNRTVIETAMASSMTDFEDAVLAHAGVLIGADVLVTRNISDFGHSPVPALDPDKFLAQIRDNGGE